MASADCQRERVKESGARKVRRFAEEPGAEREDTNRLPDASSKAQAARSQRRRSSFVCNF